MPPRIARKPGNPPGLASDVLRYLQRELHPFVVEARRFLSELVSSTTEYRIPFRTSLDIVPSSVSATYVPYTITHATPQTATLRLDLSHYPTDNNGLVRGVFLSVLGRNDVGGDTTTVGLFVDGTAAAELSFTSTTSTLQSVAVLGGVEQPATYELRAKGSTALLIIEEAQLIIRYEEA